MKTQMQRTSTEILSRLEGRALNAYVLRTLLGGSSEHATYGTEYGEDARPAVIKVIDASRRARQTQLERWAAVSQLSHSNLIPVLDYGESEIDGVPVLYVVMEWAEDNLAGVVPGRSLSPSETQEMLEPMAAAIGYLHGKGLVHAAIQPSNILATGDRLKLSTDSITPVGGVNAGHEASVYGPPESNPGIASTAGDVWSLGITLVEALTQRVPGPKDVETAHQNLPDPFSDIVRHCLRPDPAKRWTIAQIASRLNGPAVTAIAKPVQAPVQTAPIERQPAHKARQPFPKWLLPIGAGIAALVGLFAFLQSRPSAVSPGPEIPRQAAATTPAPAPPAPAPSIVPEPKTESKPAPKAKPKTEPPPRFDGATAGNGWFVVAATYRQRSFAEKRAAAIKQRWPKFNPEVYPKEEAPYYLVILGNGMSRDGASRLQAQARSAGLPGDTYITNRPGTR